MDLMNIMYDIIQFVVVVLFGDESFITIASYCMQHKLMKFGMCHLVTLDDCTPFKGTPIAICEPLNLNYDILAKRNYKCLIIDYFNRFLNKGVIIAAEERDTNEMFPLLASPQATIEISH